MLSHQVYCFYPTDVSLQPLVFPNPVCQIPRKHAGAGEPFFQRVHYIRLRSQKRQTHLQFLRETRLGKASPQVQT